MIRLPNENGSARLTRREVMNLSKTSSPETLRRIRKLARLPDEARQCLFAVSVTCLTVLKSLCREPEVAHRFVTYLARLTRQEVEETKKKPSSLSPEEWALHREMIQQAVTAMEGYLDKPSEERRELVWKLFHRFVDQQNEHQRIYGGPVRIIKDRHLLLVEYALRTVVADESSVPAWAYQTARHYAERYDSSHGTGLTPASAPLVQNIADFWMGEFGLTSEQLSAPTINRRAKHVKPPATSTKQQDQFTHRQGQFLAFIHLYRTLHRQGPAEIDMVKFFQVTPPSAHGMVVKLDELGLIIREKGVARSIRVAIPESELPKLEAVDGPPW